MPQSIAKAVFLTAFVTVTAVAFSPLRYSITPRCSATTKKIAILEALPSSSSSDNESDKDAFDMSELSRRINNMVAAEKMEQDSFDNKDLVHLPVICFDQLLPGQRLSARTTDPTFSRFLREVSLGGLFVMTSLNNKQRKLRRNGVVAKIEIVDARSSSETDPPTFTPTAVDFVVLGRKHCRVVGPSTGMVARVGRWRRVYDPDGEESVLGWGEERFVDAFPNATSLFPDTSDNPVASDSAEKPFTEWTTNLIDCAIDDEDNDDAELAEKAETLIIPLLDQWLSLASDPKTYENINVVATARAVKGHPGLRVDSAVLLEKVLTNLGDRPPPTDPSALALWGAALMNPVPVLGVSPEIRGRILEAPDARSRLKILEWGVRRSIDNLKGIAPL